MVYIENLVLIVEVLGLWNLIDFIEKWFDFIFFFGRFFKVMFEIVLVVYEKGLGIYKEIFLRVGKSIVEFICFVLGFMVVLG